MYPPFFGVCVPTRLYIWCCTCYPIFLPYISHPGFALVSCLINTLKSEGQPLEASTPLRRDNVPPLFGVCVPTRLSYLVLYSLSHFPPHKEKNFFFVKKKQTKGTSYQMEEDVCTDNSELPRRQILPSPFLSFSAKNRLQPSFVLFLAHYVDLPIA